MWFCSIKSHFVVIKILKKVKKYKFYLCSLTSENCCFYSLTEGPFSIDGSIYSFSIFLNHYSITILYLGLISCSSFHVTLWGKLLRALVFFSLGLDVNNQNHKLTPILPNASFVPIFSVSCGTCRDYSASISSSKSSSSKINALAFVQSEPWQCPHASVHFIAFLGQLHQAEQQSWVQSQ